MSGRNFIATLALVVGLGALAATPAFGAQAIDSFEMEVSTTQAGDHPDIRTKIALDSPGNPEAAREVGLSRPTVWQQVRALERELG